MFERFDERARDVVVQAQTEARALRHSYIGTEHLLLAILGQERGVGARVARRLGLEAEDVRERLVTEIGRGPAGLAAADADALETFGIDLNEVRRRVEEAFGPGALDPPVVAGRWRLRRRGCDALAGPAAGHIPFTPRAKKVLELSLREALRLGHHYIGTEHILLGIVREERGLGARILSDHGATHDVVQRAVGKELARGIDPPGASA